MSSLFEPGAVISGKYEILEKIGMGGMGAVYRAREVDFDVDRSVAIKVLPPHLMSDDKLVQRFRAEIKILAKMDHPNIVPVYSVGQEGDCLYYVMKHLRGETLRHRIRRVGSLAPAQVVQIITQITRAVDYIHRAGAVHRDLKSVNIMLDDQDNATVMDFGIAKVAGSANLTAAGEVLGTAPYMAPEQWEGKNDPRSDIYALGILMYEMLAGSPPFGGQSLAEIMAAHLHQLPMPLRTIRPQVPESVAEVVARCLAKDPAERYSTASDLLAALEYVERSLHFNGAPAADDVAHQTLVIDPAKAPKLGDVGADDFPQPPSPAAPALVEPAIPKTLFAEVIKPKRFTAKWIVLLAVAGAVLLTILISVIAHGATSTMFVNVGDSLFTAQWYVSPPILNARRAYEIALAFDGGNDDARKSLHWMAVHLARVAEGFAAQGRMGDAAEYMGWAIKIEPNPNWIRRYNRLRELAR
jgi:serine/threonine-protein kinase